jgi:hypothetical protein
MLTNEDYGQAIFDFLEDNEKFTILNEDELELFFESALADFEEKQREDILVSLEILYRMMVSKIEQITNSVSFVSEN